MEKIKRIVLFRFDKYLDVCRNRIEMIKSINPDVEIYGLFGGKPADLQQAKDCLYDVLLNIYDPHPDCDLSWRYPESLWLWKDGDLALRSWYQSIGKDINFDVLCLIEWDLLMLDSLDKLYGHISTKSVGLTGLIPINMVPENWPWIQKEPEKSEWLGLLSFAKLIHHYNFFPHACLGPGYCVPKDFLELYSKSKVLHLCNDELRLPLYSQILGFQLTDTKFYNGWQIPQEVKYFNCIKKEIDIDIIKEELSKPDGRRVFHPVFKEFRR